MEFLENISSILHNKPIFLLSLRIKSLNLIIQSSLAGYRRPKKGFVKADFNSEAAVYNIDMSTLSRGRYKNCPPSVLSNPQSSRNSIPPIKFPTLSCSRNYNSMFLIVTENKFRQDKNSFYPLLKKKNSFYLSSLCTFLFLLCHLYECYIIS